MAGKGGGAWKVAYADFVTAMMAFFMVMWISGQSAQVRESVAGYFENPLRTANVGKFSPGPKKGVGNGPSDHRSPRPAQTPSQTPRDTEAVSKANLSGAQRAGPTVFVLHDGERSSAGTVIGFPSKSDELSADAQHRLDLVLPLLLGKRYKIEVRGHVARGPKRDAHRFGENWKLCYARCIATSQYLIDHGIEPERIRLAQAGEHEPFSISGVDDLMALNDRVEVYMLTDTVEDSVGNQQERDSRVMSPDNPLSKEKSDEHSQRLEPGRRQR
jgi:chemotaxis protein MotB